MKKTNVNSLFIIKRGMAILLIVVLIIFGVSCTDNANAPEADTNGKVTGEIASSNKISEDVYIEVYAQYLYLMSVYSANVEGKDPATISKYALEMSEKLQEIYKKNGMTEDEFSEYGETLAEKWEDNPTNYAKFLEKVNKRVVELQKK